MSLRGFKVHRPPPPPFATDSLAYQLFRTLRTLGSALEGRAQAAGLNRSRGMILGQLAHHSGGITATDLRRCMGVTAASMSRLLADMERDGLLKRTPHPDDARAMLIHLTDEGQAMVQVFPTIMAEIEQIAFAGFSAQERDQLRTLLERIRANLGAARDSVDHADVDVTLTKETDNIG